MEDTNWATLPPEVLTQILHNIPICYLLNTIPNVCQAWSELLEQSSYWWKRLAYEGISISKEHRLDLINHIGQRRFVKLLKATCHHYTCIKKELEEKRIQDELAKAQFHVDFEYESMQKGLESARMQGVNEKARLMEEMCRQHELEEARMKEEMFRQETKKQFEEARRQEELDIAGIQVDLDEARYEKESIRENIRKMILQDELNEVRSQTQFNKKRIWLIQEEDIGIACCYLMFRTPRLVLLNISTKGTEVPDLDLMLLQLSNTNCQVHYRDDFSWKLADTSSSDDLLKLLVRDTMKCKVRSFCGCVKSLQILPKSLEQLCIAIPHDKYGKPLYTDFSGVKQVLPVLKHLRYHDGQKCHAFHFSELTGTTGGKFNGEFDGFVNQRCPFHENVNKKIPTY